MSGVRELAEPAWRALAAAHRARMQRWTGPHRERRRRGEPHPVLDFLVPYYSWRPAHLEQWHPGPGVVLVGAELRGPGYRGTPRGVVLGPAALPDRHRTTAGVVRGGRTATARRPARL